MLEIAMVSSQASNQNELYSDYAKTVFDAGDNKYD